MLRVLNEMTFEKRAVYFDMNVAVVVFFVLSEAIAQEQAMSSVTTQPPSLPFIDLFTGASSYYPEPIRKSYSDSGYYASCPKPDTLSSFASILGSAAKIMLSAALIAVLKLLGGKLMLFPLTVMVIAKIGLKAILLWPVLSKLMKYMKKKKKKSRMVVDCSERLACVIQRSSNSWGSKFGTAVTFSLINDEEDSFITRTLLSVLAGDAVAQCMSVDCNSGLDIS